MAPDVRSLNARRSVVVMVSVMLAVAFVNASRATIRRIVRKRSAQITAHLQESAIRRLVNANAMRTLLDLTAAKSCARKTVAIVGNAMMSEGYVHAMHHSTAKVVKCSIVQAWIRKASTVMTRAFVSRIVGNVFAINALLDPFAKLKLSVGRTVVHLSECARRCVVDTATATETLENASAQRDSRATTVQATNALVAAVDMANAMLRMRGVLAINYGMATIARRGNVRSTANKLMVSV